MTKKIKDLAVKVGTYQKDGKEKGRYINIGAVFQKDDGGEFILLNRTFNPAGVPNPENKDSIIVSSFDVKDGGTKDTAPAQTASVDDEIPF
jgi:hypothetical protein